jgi:Tol biopolymer transport system component
LFHSYSEYGAGDSKLFLFDFSMKQLTCLSLDWPIVDPMNGHFSPDGSKLVFMGRDPGTDRWNIYLWTINSDSDPTKLAVGNGIRNEDPKFSSDGTFIVFKQDGQIKSLALANNHLQMITVDGSESSMPYCTVDDQQVIYSKGAGAYAGIYLADRVTGDNHALFDEPDIQEYYPIVRDSNSVLFTRWVNAGNEHDQVFLGNIKTGTSVSLPFNTVDADYSDAFPCDESLIVLSSTCAGGRGGYDLYVSDVESGKTWSLNAFHSSINTVNQELGACYHVNK